MPAALVLPAEAAELAAAAAERVVVEQLFASRKHSKAIKNQHHPPQMP